MNAEHTTMRVWKRTLKNLRMIYALTGESMVEILDRIVKQELDRVREQQSNDDRPQGV